MITYNTYFNSYDELRSFISLHTKIQNSKQLLIQIFSGIVNPNSLQKLSQFLLKTLPHANIIGSTTDGEIIENEVSINRIVLSFSVFEKSTLKIAAVQTACNDDSFTCGENIAQKLITPNTKVFILFASGLCVNGEEFLNGVKNQSKEVITAGGLSADNTNFKDAYIICNETIQSTGAVGISINSDELYVTNKYSLAWENLGRQFVVDKAIGNRVYLIDGKTPYELYKHYLGEEVAKRLPGIGIEFPLIIQREGEKIARAVIKLHKDKSMSFAGNINQNSIVRFGIGNIEALLNGSYELYKELSQGHNESIFIYSCMARRRYLEDKAHLDINNFAKITNSAGFFTYGEFYSTAHSNEFLNESLTVLSLSESTQIEKQKELKKQKEISESLLKQKALSNIINTTSEELETLMQHLENKVEEKTQENIKHEKYIFEQDKLAQLGEMIANIAHQWRQPLSAISSNASSIILKEKLGLAQSEDTQEIMSKIIKNTEFLSETINTFRDYVKEESEEKNVIVQDRLNMVIDIMSTTLNDYSISLINNIDYSKPITKNLVIGELSQVVLNIMTNAKDVLLEKKIKNPWVKIDCFAQNQKIIISIEDNGGGINENIIEKIFDPYFTTKEKSEGTGIGLYMSKNIIKNHFKGELYIKNSSNGAQFFIEIPLD